MTHELFSISVTEVRPVIVQVTDSPIAVMPSPHSSSPLTLLSYPSRNSSYPNTKYTSVIDVNRPGFVGGS